MLLNSWLSVVETTRSLPLLGSVVEYIFECVVILQFAQTASVRSKWLPPIAHTPSGYLEWICDFPDSLPKPCPPPFVAKRLCSSSRA